MSYDSEVEKELALVKQPSPVHNFSYIVDYDDYEVAPGDKSCLTSLFETDLNKPASLDISKFGESLSITYRTPNNNRSSLYQLLGYYTYYQVLHI